MIKTGGGEGYRLNFICHKDGASLGIENRKIAPNDSSTSGVDRFEIGPAQRLYIWLFDGSVITP